MKEIRRLIRKIKTFCQRGKKGYGDVDLLLYDKYLALFIINSMSEFLKFAQLSDNERRKGEMMIRLFKEYFFESVENPMCSFSHGLDVLEELYQNWWN